jgi:uncharacterized protein
MKEYRAPWWLPGGNLQTIWPALAARRTRGPSPQYRRERWTTPDADFLDVDWLAPPQAGEPGAAAPLLVLFHGLEGSSRSHYAAATMPKPSPTWRRARAWLSPCRTFAAAAVS